MQLPACGGPSAAADAPDRDYPQFLRFAFARRGFPRPVLAFRRSIPSRLPPLSYRRRPFRAPALRSSVQVGFLRPGHFLVAGDPFVRVLDPVRVSRPVSASSWPCSLLVLQGKTPGPGERFQAPRTGAGRPSRRIRQLPSFFQPASARRLRVRFQRLPASLALFSNRLSPDGAAAASPPAGGGTGRISCRNSPRFRIVILGDQRLQDRRPRYCDRDGNFFGSRNLRMRLGVSRALASMAATPLPAGTAATTGDAACRFDPRRAGEQRRVFEPVRRQRDHASATGLPATKTGRGTTLA